MSTPTIHNNAKIGEIAKTVLMPGDPVRAQYIARTFLTETRLVNDVRCAYAFTGKYKGKDVSVMASGMGSGSMGIYSHELFGEYGVDRIIRIGSAGGLNENLHLGDVVVALSASTDSGYATHYALPGFLSPTVSGEILKKLIRMECESNLQFDIRYGAVFSGAAFHYSDEFFSKWKEMGILAVEMETAALYWNAAELHKEALSMFTISDILSTGEHYTTKEREISFSNMISFALDFATRL